MPAAGLRPARPTLKMGVSASGAGSRRGLTQPALGRPDWVGCAPGEPQPVDGELGPRKPCIGPWSGCGQQQARLQAASVIVVAERLC